MHSLVFWTTPHQIRRDGQGAKQAPTLGKLHPKGLQLLQALGWEERPNDTTEVPVFSLTARRGGDFPASGQGLPLIRQFPQECTELLDDKRTMWRVLAEGHAAWTMPPTWSTPECLLEAAAEDRALCEQITALGVYLKHRRGVQGKSVHFHQSVVTLREHAARLPGSSFVAQMAVQPWLSARGHRMTHRAHVLFTSSSVYVHRRYIAQEHALPYICKDRGAHVSSAAKLSALPEPAVLDAAEEPLLFAGVLAIARACFEAARRAGGVPGAATGGDAQRLYHLFAFDFARDGSSEGGAPLLLEINAYPALHSGTMSRVDVGLYNALIADTLSLVVLPVTHGLPPDPGGWALCHPEAGMLQAQRPSCGGRVEAEA